MAFLCFFVSILDSDFGYIFLMVCNEVTFCIYFKKQKYASQNLRLYKKKNCFPLLASILSTCIITSSLIHEAMTFIGKLFQF